MNVHTFLLIQTKKNSTQHCQNFNHRFAKNFDFFSTRRTRAKLKYHFHIQGGKGLSKASVHVL